MPLRLNLVTVYPLIRYWHSLHAQFNIGPGASVTLNDIWGIDARILIEWWYQQSTLGNNCQIEMYVFAPAGWQILGVIVSGAAPINVPVEMVGGGTPMVRVTNMGAGISNCTVLGYSWETY